MRKQRAHDQESDGEMRQTLSSRSRVLRKKARVPRRKTPGIKCARPVDGDACVRQIELELLRVISSAQHVHILYNKQDMGFIIKVRL